MVALGAAAELAAHRLESGAQHAVQRLRDELRSAVPGLTLNGHPESRLPNTLSVSFPGS